MLVGERRGRQKTEDRRQKSRSGDIGGDRRRQIGSLNDERIRSAAFPSQFDQNLEAALRRSRERDPTFNAALTLKPKTD